MSYARDVISVKHNVRYKGCKQIKAKNPAIFLQKFHPSKITVFTVVRSVMQNAHILA